MYIHRHQHAIHTEKVTGNHRLKFSSTKMVHEKISSYV